MPNTTNTNQNKKYFRASVTGDAKDRGACAFMFEAYVTNKVTPRYFEAADGKKSRYTFGINVDTNAWETLGRAEGDAEKYKDRVEAHVIFCIAFGRTADELNKTPPTGRVLLTGKFSRNVYKDNAGEERESVGLTVYNVVPVTTLTDAPKYIGGMKVVNKRGEEQIMLCNACGTISYVGELRQGQTDPYLNFSFTANTSVSHAYAMTAGEADQATDSQSLSATVWGKRAESLSRFLRKGMTGVVTGTVQRSENNGNTYYNMNVRGLVLYPAPKDGSAPAPAAPAANPAPAAAPAASAAPDSQFAANLAAIAEEEDDELPF